MKSKRLMGGIVGLAVLSWLAFGASACGSSTTPTTDHTFVSTSVHSHSHTIILSRADLNTPPASGLTMATTPAVGHTHTFSMSQAQLITVAGGTPVTITTGPTEVTGTHAHEFTISKWF